MEVPAGKYYIGSVRLCSHTTLLLRAGAEVYGSRDPEVYCIAESDTLEPLPEEWQTEKCWTEGGNVEFRNVTCDLPKEQWLLYTDEPFKCKDI